MISAIIMFNDITSIFVRLMKSTFVKINLNDHFDNTLRLSYQKKKNSRNSFKAFINVFDYLSTRHVEFKFIIILLMMFAFNAALLTFTIKQSNILFVFSDNVKNA